MKKTLIIAAITACVGYVCGNIRMCYYIKKKQQHEEVMKKAQETLEMLDSMNKDIGSLCDGYDEKFKNLLDKFNEHVEEDPNQGFSSFRKIISSYNSLEINLSIYIYRRNLK